MKHAIRYSAFVAIVVASFIGSASAGDAAKQPPPYVPEFIDAVSRGDLEKVKKLLESGQKPDEAGNSAGGTALMEAAFFGHIEIMKILIAHGADVKLEAGFERMTALDYAADGGHVEAVALLLEKGADARHVGAEGRTALYHAVEFGGKNGGVRGGGSVEVAKLLIDKGADVNAKFFDWKLGSLCLAASKGNKEMVELLIARGADVDAKTAGGHTALQAARREAKSTHDEVFDAIARILVEHGAKE